MEKVRLSTLSKDTIVLVDGYSNINTVEDILEDLEGYKNKSIYTTTEHHASFDAKSVLDDAIEYEYNNGMYEDWDDSIKADITDEDITDLQKILDRILARSPMTNIAYESDKLIEIDICNSKNKFPILGSEPKEYIPLDIVKPHEKQAIINHNQTLQRLAERGGLGWVEMLFVLEDKNYDFHTKLTEISARFKVLEIVEGDI